MQHIYLIGYIILKSEGLMHFLVLNLTQLSSANSSTVETKKLKKKKTQWDIAKGMVKSTMHVYL